jgi:hypothetical protein
MRERNFGFIIIISPKAKRFRVEAKQLLAKLLKASFEYRFEYYLLMVKIYPRNYPQ